MLFTRYMFPKSLFPSLLIPLYVFAQRHWHAQCSSETAHLHILYVCVFTFLGGNPPLTRSIRVWYSNQPKIQSSSTTKKSSVPWCLTGAYSRETKRLVMDYTYISDIVTLGLPLRNTQRKQRNYDLSGLLSNDDYLSFTVWVWSGYWDLKVRNFDQISGKSLIELHAKYL